MDSLEGYSESLVRDIVKNRVEGLLSTDSIKFPNIYISNISVESEKVTVVLTSESFAKRKDLIEMACLIKEKVESGTEKDIKVIFSSDSFI